MSILTEKEIAHIAGAESRNVMEFARAIESAVLARLAGMELPPVPDLTQEEREFLHYNPNTSDLVDFVQGHAAEYGRQAFAQGAAAQLAEKPSAWKWKVNRCHQHLEAYPPPDDAYDEGTLIELYTLKEPK